MHKLLQRQLTRYIGATEAMSDEWKRFIGAVDDAYRQADSDRLLLERSMELTSQELLDRNRELRQDIAERTRADEELRASEQRYRRLFEGNYAGVYRTTEDGRFLDCNESFTRILGYASREELLALPTSELYFDIAHRQNYVNRLREQRAVTNLELCLRTKQGDPVWILLNANLTAGEANSPDVIEGTMIDITERKQIEEALQRGNEELELHIIERTAALTNTNKQLQYELTERKRADEALQHAKTEAEEANRAKSEFLSRMSHELRTPLNGILGFAQLLEMNQLAPAEHQRVGHILKAGRHLLALINEVLEISRIEAGKLSLSPEAVSLGETMQECLDLIRPMATQRSIQLHTHATARRTWYVLADHQRLKQVLLNLMSNAVKYNREGGSISLACEELQQSRMRIWVSDTGLGIPADKLERLFTPFERLEAERTGIEGTGLGLALSKRLIEAMGGTIGVKSAIGEGSTFWLDLPLVEGPVERLEREGTGPLAANLLPRQTHTLLYIEDNLSNLELVEDILEYQPGIKLLPAMHGGLGLQLAREHRPDLILLDVHLPDMLGSDVLRTLQEDPTTRSIPVVVVSADATARQIDHLLAAGATAYLTKPLDVKQFLQVLRETLREESQ